MASTNPPSTSDYPVPIFQTSPYIESKWDKSLIYVFGVFQDKTNSMLCTFSLSTPKPFDTILDYLSTEFNPGADASSKLNGVRLFILIDNLETEERIAIATQWVEMLQKIVMFNVYATGILMAVKFEFVDGETLRLGIHPTETRALFSIGVFGLPLEPKSKHADKKSPP